MKPLLVPICMLFLYSCSSVQYTQRHQLMLLSESEEIRLGTKAFEEVKAQSRSSLDADSNDIIQRVGQRIAAVADRPDYQWEFLLIENDQTINAFALPGGKVIFYTGVLPLCVDESGIATVMGHEVSHVLARHGAERMSQGQLASIGRVALSFALATQDLIAQKAALEAYGFGTSAGVLLPFSRTHEIEADQIGLILMAKAGYDPRAAIEFWKRMAENSKNKERTDFLSTHPSDEKRIEELEIWLPIAMEFYRKATQKNVQLL